MLPACRISGEGFAIPTFDLVPSDVEGFMEELWEFQSAFHDCFARSEPRAHFFDSMVGQCSNPTTLLNEVSREDAFSCARDRHGADAVACLPRTVGPHPPGRL